MGACSSKSETSITNAHDAPPNFNNVKKIVQDIPAQDPNSCLNMPAILLRYCKYFFIRCPIFRRLNDQHLLVFNNNLF